MNNDPSGYAVFFFPPALEALGDAIKPYLQDGPAGPHVPCREVDTAGAFIELTLEGRTPDGRDVSLELMVPGNMVRMIVSARADTSFGFHDRHRVTAAMVEPGLPLIAPAPATPEPAEGGVTEANAGGIAAAAQAAPASAAGVAQAVPVSVDAAAGAPAPDKPSA